MSFSPYSALKVMEETLASPTLGLRIIFLRRADGDRGEYNGGLCWADKQTSFRHLLSSILVTTIGLGDRTSSVLNVQTLAFQTCHISICIMIWAKGLICKLANHFFLYKARCHPKILFIYSPSHWSLGREHDVEFKAFKEKIDRGLSGC